MKRWTMMKSRGTYYVPTLMAAEGLKERLTDGYLPPVVAAKARQAIAALDATVRKAIARGVKVVVGTDATVYPHGRNAEEFHLLVNLGMKPVRGAQGRHVAGCRTTGGGRSHRLAGDREVRRYRGVPGQSRGEYPAGGTYSFCDEGGRGLPAGGGVIPTPGIRFVNIVMPR